MNIRQLFFRKCTNIHSSDPMRSYPIPCPSDFIRMNASNLFFFIIAVCYAQRMRITFRNCLSSKILILILICCPYRIVSYLLSLVYLEKRASVFIFVYFFQIQYRSCSFWSHGSFQYLSYWHIFDLFDFESVIGHWQRRHQQTSPITFSKNSHALRSLSFTQVQYVSTFCSFLLHFFFSFFLVFGLCYSLNRNMKFHTLIMSFRMHSEFLFLRSSFIVSGAFDFAKNKNKTKNLQIFYNH